MGPVGGRGRGPPACLRHRTPEAGVGPLGDRGHPRTPDAQRGRPQRRPARSQPGSGPPAVPGAPPGAHSPERGPLARGLCSRLRLCRFASWPFAVMGLRPVAVRGDLSSPGRSLKLGLGPLKSRGQWVLWSLLAAGVAGVLPPEGQGPPQAVAEARAACVTLAPPKLRFPEHPLLRASRLARSPEGFGTRSGRQPAQQLGSCRWLGHRLSSTCLPSSWSPSPGLAPAGGAPAPPAGHSAAELEA